MCAAVVAVLYILLCHHTCVQPRCRAPGLRDSPTASAVRSFPGYSRVPDGKVRGDGLAHLCFSFPLLWEGQAGAVVEGREGRRS